jgi:hypothetical protein
MPGENPRAFVFGSAFGCPGGAVKPGSDLGRGGLSPYCGVYELVFLLSLVSRARARLQL